MYIVSDEQEMLQYTQEIRFGWGVHGDILQDFETILHVVHIDANVIKSSVQFVRIFLSFGLEHVQLSLYYAVGFRF